MFWVSIVGVGIAAGAVKILLRPRQAAVTVDRVSDQWLLENRVDRL
jgi:hypothetical protein